MTDSQSNNNGRADVLNVDENNVSFPLDIIKVTNGGHTSKTPTLKNNTLAKLLVARKDSTAEPFMSRGKFTMNEPFSRFGRMVLFHFMTELWAYHILNRLGLLLLSFGILFQIISVIYQLVITISFLPFINISPFLLVPAGYIYLFQIDSNNILHKYWTTAFKVLHNIFNAAFLYLKNLDGKGIRRVTLVILLCPILSEMWMLTFLARVLNGFTRSGDINGTLYGYSIPFKMVLLQVIVAVPSFCHISVNNNKAHKNEADSYGSSCDDTFQIQPALKIGRITITKKEKKTISECRTQALVYLYISSVLKMLVMINYDQIHRPVLLAGHFFFASGIFLILISFQCSGNGSNILSELVQSSIRFALIDALKHVGEGVAEDEMLKLVMLRWIVDYWTFSSPSSLASDNVTITHADSCTIQASRGTHQSGVNAERGLSWQALSTMLGMTTAQMQNETTPALSDNKACLIPNYSVRNLQSMLSSLHVDKRAKTAVLSYEMAVNECHPSRWIAIILASMRRCSALCSILFLYMSGSSDRVHISITLFPIILLELTRMKNWSDSCHRAIMIKLKGKGASQKYYTSLWMTDEMESMEILLSRDNYSPDNEGPVLRVWGNLKYSVVALQSGLTAMTSIQPVESAPEVAFDIIPLIKIDFEIGQQRISHALKVCASGIQHLSRGRYESHEWQSNAIFYKLHDIARSMQTVLQKSMREVIETAVLANGCLCYPDKHSILEECYQREHTTQIAMKADEGTVLDHSDLNIGSQLEICRTNKEIDKQRVFSLDEITRLKKGLVLNKNALDVINYHNSNANGDHDLRIQSAVLLFNKTQQGVENIVSADTIDDVKMMGISSEATHQSIVDETDSDTAKDNRKCIVIKDKASKKVQQHNEHNDFIGLGKPDFKENSDISDTLQDRISADYLSHVVSGTFENDRKQNSGDVVEDQGKKDDKKHCATKADVKKGSKQGNGNREANGMEFQPTVDSLSCTSDEIELYATFNQIEDDDSFISDDGSWTEIEQVNLNTNHFKTVSGANIQYTETCSNNMSMRDEIILDKKNRNGSKLKSIGARLVVLGSWIGNITNGDSSGKEEHI